MKRLRVSLRAPEVACAPGDNGEAVLTARWATLSSFISTVHAATGSAAAGGGGGASTAAAALFSFEELYGAVADVVSSKSAPALFDRLRAVFEARVAALLDPLLTASPDAAAFLVGVDAAWSVRCAELTLQRAIFTQLDTTYVATLPGVRSLWDLGLAQWGAHLLRSPLLARVSKSVVELVQRERDGNAVERASLVAVVRMLGAVGLLQAHVVAPLTESTRDYYAREGARLADTLAVPAYLLLVEARLREEVRKEWGGCATERRTLNAALLHPPPIARARRGVPWSRRERRGLCAAARNSGPRGGAPRRGARRRASGAWRHSDARGGAPG